MNSELLGPKNYWGQVFPCDTQGTDLTDTIGDDQLTLSSRTHCNYINNWNSEVEQTLPVAFHIRGGSFNGKLAEAIQLELIYTVTADPLPPLVPAPPVTP